MGPSLEQFYDDPDDGLWVSARVAQLAAPRVGDLSLQAFVTLALALFAVPALLGYCYYLQGFRIKSLEEPTNGVRLSYEKDPAELAFFRKKTNPDFVEPALEQLARLNALREQVQDAVVQPNDYEPRMAKLIRNLENIMDAARLRQIPQEYQKEYLEVLAGLSESAKSGLALVRALATEDREEKERRIRGSIALSRSAERRLRSSQKFFHVIESPARTKHSTINP